MAKFKIRGIVVDICEQEIIIDQVRGEYSCTPFVIESNDDHPSKWLFKTYGDISIAANRLIVGDEVEVEFTSRDKKTNRWHSNKVALSVRIITDAPGLSNKIHSTGDDDWNK